MATRLRDRIDANGGIGAFHRLEPREPTELERFMRLWPTVADRIGITAEPEEPRRFALGEVFYQKQVDGAGIGPVIARGLADRHSRDAGAAVFDGLITSRYVLEPAEQQRWPRPKLWDDHYGERPTRAVDVVTSLAERFTLMTIVKLPS